MNVSAQTTIHSRPIEILPAHIVNQIAAGEVVERPASVVKELIDNALDAGATRISIEIESGGVELIHITDNGQGISPDELPLAVHPHATSKIRSPEDLASIATMGFRGEALASIASVSRLSMRSRRAGHAGAARLDVDGGSIAPLRPEAGPVGTSVTVRNLFFNTPARRKFLRTATTEQGHCLDIVRDLAISHPAIGFEARADGKLVLELPPDQSPRARALAVIGAEMESQYLEVHADQFDDARGVALWGLIGLPSMARPTTKWQHIFVRGRPVRDKTIQHALREAYRGLIEPGRHPAAMLMLELDPGAVDVNVHPTKAEVRFRDSGIIHQVVYRAVRDALQARDLRAQSTSPSALRFERAESSSGLNQSAANTQPVRERFSNYFQRFVPSSDGKGFDYEGLRKAVEEEQARIEAEQQRIIEEKARLQSVHLSTLADEHLRPSIIRDAPGQGSMDALKPASRLLQVHNSFLVTQDEDGLVIIDQHALHERVMFELFSARMSQGSLESQRLLVPSLVETTAARAEIAARLSPLLSRLGIELEPMGPQSLGIHGFPTLLFDKKVDPAEFIAELLEKAEEDNLADIGSKGATEESVLHEILDMMACKAAVKAGDSLSDEELTELLKMRAQVERSSNCPHGRPTAIRVTIKELERQFGRI